MNDMPVKEPKRKVLRLPRESKREAQQEIDNDPTRFTRREDCVFMVFNENGDMPKRVYRPDEIHLAYSHATNLARKHGGRFHVMRSWRTVEALDG